MINRSFIIFLFILIIVAIKLKYNLAIKTNKQHLILKKNYAEIQISSTEALKIYKHWLEGAYSGVIAALANQRYIFKVNKKA